MTEIKLKPCPFCGGKKFIFAGETNFYNFQKIFGNAYLNITCESCDLQMWERSFYIHNYSKRMKLLAKKWNRRTDNETD